MQGSKLGMWKRHCLWGEGIRKGYLLCQKWFIKGYGDRTRRGGGGGGVHTGISKKKIAARFFVYNVWMFSSTFSNYIEICLERLRRLVVFLWFNKKIEKTPPLVFTFCFCQQSMKLGVPVLARNIPGNSAVIQHGESGLLFDTPQVRQVTQTNCLYCDRY